MSTNAQCNSDDAMWSICQAVEGKTRFEKVTASVVLEPPLTATPNFSLSDKLITEGDVESLWFAVGYLSAKCGMSNW